MDKETRKKKYFPLTLLTEYFNLCLCRCKSIYFCIHKVRTFGVSKYVLFYCLISRFLNLFSTVKS